MDQEIAWVAERLACEFGDLPSPVVVAAVCRCLDECSSASPFFVEQAARARLRVTGRVPRQRTPEGHRPAGPPYPSTGPGLPALGPGGPLPWRPWPTRCCSR